MGTGRAIASIATNTVSTSQQIASSSLEIIAKAADQVTVPRPRTAGAFGDCSESLASEVLQRFCTPSQWRQWERDGALICHGNRSGHPYRLVHRKRHLFRRSNPIQPTVAYDLCDSAPVHCFDWMLPPPEEVLAIMLYLQLQEEELRNVMTMPGARGPVFTLSPRNLHETLRDRYEAQQVRLFEQSLSAQMGMLTRLVSSRTPRA